MIRFSRLPMRALLTYQYQFQGMLQKFHLGILKDCEPSQVSIIRPNRVILICDNQRHLWMNRNLAIKSEGIEDRKRL
jgi:hypothetical protein